MARLRAMLEAAGFTFNKAIGCWINKAEGRVISREAVAAHDEDSLAKYLATVWAPPRSK